MFTEDYFIKLSKPSSYMLFLLMVTAPFDCKTFIKKTIFSDDTFVNNACNTKVLEINSSITSTMAGIKELRNNCPLISKKLYNIFGHNPNGFGTTIDVIKSKDKDNSNKTYLINLDTSNTFAGTSFNTNYESYNYIKISNLNLNNKDPIVEIFTNIKISTNDANSKKLLDPYIIPHEETVLSYTSDIKPTEITIQNIINDKMDTQIESLYEKYNNKNNLFYHGISNDNKIVYSYHLTPKPPKFPKCLFVIDNVQKGGNMYYYNKYLKYKNKYMILCSKYNK